MKQRQTEGGREDLQDRKRRCLVYLDRQTKTVGKSCLLKKTNEGKLALLCIKRYFESSVIKIVWHEYMKGEGNGTPLQYSCLENPMDRGSLVGCSPWGCWVRHDWATSHSIFTFMHWRRKWQPTAVFLPGELQGQGSLVGCRLWGLTESDTTEAT